MRKIFLLLAFVPFFAKSQTVEIGLGGGVCTNTGPFGTSIPEKGLQLGYAGTFNLFLHIKSWQFGIAAEGYQLKTKTDYTESTVAGDLHITGHSDYGSPQLPLLLEINKLFYQRKSYFYIGVAGWSGINFLKDPAGGMVYNGLQPVFGAQVGYTYGLSDLVGININLAARYNGIPDAAMISFPLTVGIRLRP